MPDPLIDTIARELGIDADKAAEMLQTFGRQCREQAEAGLPTPLPHVGELRRKNRTVTFVPAEALIEALHQRHSDLEPIALSVPAPPTSDAEATSEDTADPQAIAFAPTPPAPDETQEESPPPASPTETSPEAPAEEAVVDTPEEDLPTAPRTQQDRHPSSMPRRGRRVLVGVLVALVLLVATAALAFFLVYDGDVANLPFAVPGITVEQTATTTPEAPPDTSSTVIPVAPSVADTASTATDATSAPPSPSIVPSDGGWTIIVGAYQTRPEADSLLTVFRNRLSDETLPVDILTADEGTTRFRHRIAVGQYDSQDAANTARSNLGDQLPSDAWILRLQ